LPLLKFQPSYLAVSVLRRAAASLFLSLARSGIETEIISVVYVETIRFVLETASRSCFRNRNGIAPK